ncbi:hypothetical protein GCM10009564_27930 [Streptomyces thermogriseus]|jgi:hypothetical protein|uniref:Uncharacterized protein n=1 Tax=Streptomyces thermogriseus TaxID=75292 RepID=A0ABP4DH32_9ACTN
MRGVRCGSTLPACAHARTQGKEPSADGTAVDGKRVDEPKGPSAGRQIGVCVALLLVDFMLIVWSAYAVGVAAWAGSFDSSTAASSTSEAALVALLLPGGGAVLAGGALLALGRRVPGIMQLVLLGSGALLVPSMVSG